MISVYKRMKFDLLSFILYAVYMSTDKSLSHTFISLSNRESIILRCFASGMAKESVCKTLEITSMELNEYVRSLMVKFGVHNQYHLIKKAIRKGLLDSSNFVAEDVKNLTLEFVEKQQDNFPKYPLSEQGKWDLYQLLLCFINEIETIQIEGNKKIPPKRD